MKSAFSISVRDLVAFILRSGDLRTDFMSTVSAVEGIRAHQRIQRQRPEGYQAEVPVRYLVSGDDFELTISGRIDGVFPADPEPIIEEIKTTRRDLKEIEASPSAIHWGQAQCYAYMYARQEGVTHIAVRLTYAHLDSGRTLELTRRFDTDGLARYFDDLLGQYLAWVRRLSGWSKIRDKSIEQLEFPFAGYRPGQREMAVAVFRTVRDGQHLFVQAATGIGKTMASLYPAIKALGQHQVPKVVFLTARTTGRLAAEAALQTLGQKGLRLKWVSLTAKDKICFIEVRNCTPEHCPYALGHFDRLNDALVAAFEYDALTRETIEQLAREHRVCPFEFSLELINWADGVVGDYNYAFDPFVTLQRLFGQEAGGHAVLVDEAHNLVDRSREMFSATLSKQPFLELRRDIKSRLPKIYKALGSINAWLAASRRQCVEAGGVLIDQSPPETLLDRLAAFLRMAEKWLQKNIQTDYRDKLLQLYFECRRFIHVADSYNTTYATIAEADGKAARIKLFCMDPSAQLRACWQQCKAAVLFSATLTPPDYFKTILGCHEDAQRLDLLSPFPRRNLCVFEASNISTFYQQRQATASRVTEVIADMVLQRTGNYLLFFPSYAYMTMIYERFNGSWPSIRTIVQAPNMTESEREQFLDHFSADARQTLVGFAVMGGIFGEGIDLQGERLTGAVIVGVGLPGMGSERNLIRDYYDKASGCGFEYAYQFPGINRVLQAVGRVIRSETDRGVVLLIDQRYAQHRYRSLLPPSWQIQPAVDAADFKQRLMAFWEQG